MHDLMFRSIKFSFLLSFAISVLLVLNMDFILHLWLETVPEYAIVFCQIRVVDWTMWMFATPLYLAILSSGKIKKFMIIDSAFVFMNFILSYIFLSQKYSPISVPCIYISVNVFRSVLYLIFSKKVTNLSIWQCFHKVCFRLLIVILISVPLPVWISFHTESLKALLATSISFLLPFLLSSILFGLDKNERALLLSLSVLKRKIQ
jgi:Na+-driven multidrug efflux pump